MKRTILALTFLGILTGPAVWAHGHKHWCEPGYKIVECIEYKETIRDVCRNVEDVKKVSKWVYSCKEDPFCIQRGGPRIVFCHHCEGKGCPRCKGPYDRIQLVKKEVITEIPITKCIVEKVVEVCPVKTYKKIRCTDPCPPNAHVVFDGDNPKAYADLPAATESPAKETLPSRIIPASVKPAVQK